MVTLSPSQKKTVFAVALLALIAVGVMVSGRGGFSSLRSDAFNNPSFVCTDASMVSGEVKYNGVAANLQKFSTEKASLETKIQEWNADIRKNEAQIKKLEKEKVAAEKKERALEAYIKKNCAARPMSDCAAKRKELQDTKQDIKKAENSLTNEKNQNKSIRTNIQNAQSNIKLLTTQIQDINNFKEDYETCKRALEGAKIEVANFDIIISGEVFVNEPSDITVRVLKSGDTVNNKYEGKIFFDTNSNAADLILPLQENDGGSEYQFQTADNGIKVFEKGVTFKKAGSYELTVFELTGPDGGVSKTVQIVAKEKTSPITCIDSDNGHNYYTKGQTILSNDVVSADFCSSTNTLDEYICPTVPSESGVSQTYTCPHGCSEGACKTGPYCGNGIKEGTEQCDDGNTNNDDSCDNNCKNTGVTEGGKLTVSLDSSSPLSRLLLDNTTEHELEVFRLAASNTENLDLKSIKIANFGTGGINGVNFYKFYNGATLLGTATPDSSGNAELFLTDGTLVIPANDYKLVTVKAVLRDINGINFKNGDTLITAIKPAGYIKTVGMTSGNLIISTEANMIGNTMTAFEAYPIVTFAPDNSIGTAVTLSQNQLIAKVALTNPGNKDVTFQSGDGNNFSIQIQVVGDDTDGDIETISLRDQDGRSLEMSSITSATGITRIDFGMLLRDPNIGTTIPAGQTKYFYIYADTSDLEDNGDIIQVWLDDDSNTNNLSFGINGVGNYSIGNIIFRDDLFGPILSRSF